MKINIKIDAENAFLIEHPHCIFEEYPYVLGIDLADKTLEKTATYPIIIYTMLSITETLTKETYQSVQSKLRLGNKYNMCNYSKELNMHYHKIINPNRAS